MGELEDGLGLGERGRDAAASLDVINAFGLSCLGSMKFLVVIWFTAPDLWSMGVQLSSSSVPVQEDPVMNSLTGSGVR
jgi:hypothetical protein